MGSCHKIPRAKAQIGYGSAMLRQVAGDPIATHGRHAKNPELAGAGLEQPKHGPQQRRFACTVSAENADEFAGPNGRACLRNNGASAPRKRNIVEFNRIQAVYRPPSAWSSASSCESIHA